MIRLQMDKFIAKYGNMDESYNYIFDFETRRLLKNICGYLSNEGNEIANLYGKIEKQSKTIENLQKTLMEYKGLYKESLNKLSKLEKELKATGHKIDDFG